MSDYRILWFSNLTVNPGERSNRTRETEQACPGCDGMLVWRVSDIECV